MRILCRLFVSVFSFTIITIVSGQPSYSKITASVKHQIEVTAQTETIPVWIYFKDKGVSLGKKMDSIRESLNEKTYRRRLKHLGPENLVDEYDIPVNETYVEAVSGLVHRVRHKSKWLNAVSAEVNIAAVSELNDLDFVEKIDMVRTSTAVEPVFEEPVELKTGLQKTATALNYGQSLEQNSVNNVVEMHNLGYDGNGILIAMFDSGFNNLEHVVFENLIIEGTWDFVNNDSNVDDQSGQAGSGSHGTKTLSVIAGFREGELIGTAYGASYLLAKTENTESERHVEEDNWIAAAEWAESLGADIINSSLGYRDGFTDGTDYTSEDMDGNTTVVTLGAEIAASKGILVVNSAGNEGPASTGENTLVAPSDGFNVLAVGAVTSSLVRADFSSMGPTADGRTKPDVMAMGQTVLAASNLNNSSYIFGSGTSFSSPLAAGAAALLIQAVPSITNTQIIQAFRSSGDNTGNPDNSYGWGVFDVLNALNTTEIEDDPVVIDDFKLNPAYPNPFNPSTTISYELPVGTFVTLKVYNLLGQEIITLARKFQSAGVQSEIWNGTNSVGQIVTTGVYIIRLQSEGFSDSRKVLFLK